jgi:hypothetical protein
MSAEVAEAAGEVAKTIEALLRASMQSCSLQDSVDEAVIGFVAESVAASVETGEMLSSGEALSLFQDAGLQTAGLDEEDLVDIAETIEVLTKGNPQEEEEEDEEGELIDDGSCEMCERFVSKRTFHHLIPKEMHARYLKRKSLPENLEQLKGAQCTRLWLNNHGVLICRSCHWAIHKAEPNNILSMSYNTLDRLLEHPKIRAFAKYNSKRRVSKF